MGQASDTTLAGGKRVTNHIHLRAACENSLRGSPGASTAARRVPGALRDLLTCFRDNPEVSTATPFTREETDAERFFKKQRNRGHSISKWRSVAMPEGTQSPHSGSPAVPNVLRLTGAG